MRIVLDVEDNERGSPRIIVSHPTGIFYTEQVGGIACWHPEAEGFVMYLNHDIDFDDCSAGLCCAPIYENKEERENDKNEYRGIRESIAKEIDILLNGIKFGKIDYGRIFISQLSFNFDKIYEFTEDWWPVKVELSRVLPNVSASGLEYYSDAVHIESKQFEGYLTRGNNCD